MTQTHAETICLEKVTPPLGVNLTSMASTKDFATRGPLSNDGCSEAHGHQSGMNHDSTTLSETRL
jgi:hypothetical protein